ncbi:SRPBCC family protein [Rhizobium alvei]|uniref:SRPBCC family protein n=1 Tax=Rhizobium alvei TaxID=1132659 RepID=A0ABT8YS51_9HYPH|nr:SRPBCC family protein [Rhizobium alvei]MDO6966188.1 SRPBCC family protein [Rhizobium alvei]
MTRQDKAETPISRFATLTFERALPVSRGVAWQTWTAPAARAIWAAPTPSVVVEFLEADTRVGGREISLCKVDGQDDIRCECGWLEIDPEVRSVNYEGLSSKGEQMSTALVTADFAGDADSSHLAVTVQLSARSDDLEAGYRQGFEAGLAHLAAVAARTMVLQRIIKVPRSIVWKTWIDPEILPQWWGPNGFSCRTKRIDLRSGGEWVFDMIAPDGTVFPNHHQYSEIRPEDRIAYALLWGENGPKHADAWASFEDCDGGTKVTLGMVFSSEAEFREAKGFGAVELGMQTLGKLERMAQSR